MRPTPDVRPTVAPPTAPVLGVTLTPPAWFRGDPRRWQDARQRFERATRQDVDSAQHVLVGGALLVLGGLTLGRWLPLPDALRDGALFPWALMLCAALAMMLGNRGRDRAHVRMMLAIEQVVVRSANPQVTGPVGQDPDADQTVAIEACSGRLRSPHGSFDELASAVVEARMLGGVVIAPLRWRGGMVFRTMVPVAVPSQAVPTHSTDRPER